MLKVAPSTVKVPVGRFVKVPALVARGALKFPTFIVADEKLKLPEFVMVALAPFVKFP